MLKKILIFSFFALGLEVSSTVIKKTSPRSLIDEAKTQLAELRSTVQSAIGAAEVNLRDLNAGVIILGQDTIKAGELEIQSQHETTIQNLNTIKELGHSADVNISECLNHREEFLHRLPQVIGHQLQHCINGHVIESGRLVGSSKYIIEATMHRVDDLGYQLDLCSPSNILCISPIVRQIGVEMVDLPERIKSEVTKDGLLVDTLEVSIQECSTTKVAQYSTDSTSILTEISDCVSNLI